jgi:hypothetical protein
MRLTIILLLCSLFSFGQVTKNQEWVFQKKVTLNDSVKITAGATNGYVLTSDVDGIATWQPSGSGVIQTATVTLDSTDILSLHTSPIVIVPAQGANTLIVPIRITYYYEYNTAEYQTSTSLQVQVGGTNVNTNSAFLGYTSNALYTVAAGGYAASGSISSIDGDLTITAPTSNPTNGNSTLKVTVIYTVVNL